VFLPLEIWTMSRIAADFAGYSYGKLAQVEIRIAHVSSAKRKAREGVDSAVARFTGFMQFVLLNPGAYPPGFIPPPTFVRSYQGGTPPFPGAPRDPSPASWTLIIHCGSPPFPGAAPDPSPTSWTLIIHGGSPPFPIAPLARPSPISLDLIIMSVLLLSAAALETSRLLGSAALP
jgi:hypothetical protein